MKNAAVSKSKIAVSVLTLSLAGLAAILGHEGFRAEPYVPTKGDVPTIGYGSTVYEDGSRVELTDAPITRDRALQLAKNHASKDESIFRSSLPGVKLTQGEYDLYLDFSYQYGTGAWRSSPMRSHLLGGRYVQACNALAQYRFMTSARKQGAGWVPYKFDARHQPIGWKFDCSTPGNRVCRGVWARQQERIQKCLSEQ